MLISYLSLFLLPLYYDRQLVCFPHSGNAIVIVKSFASAVMSIKWFDWNVS